MVLNHRVAWAMAEVVMIARETDEHEDDGSVAQERRRYREPKLQELGRLHVRTLATGPVNGDAGQGMMVSMA